MAVIINSNQDLIDAVNAAGFDTTAEFVEFMKAGRLQVRMAGRNIANTVLDAQLNTVMGQIAQQKQANTDANNTDAAALAQIFAGQ